MLARALHPLGAAISEFAATPNPSRTASRAVLEPAGAVAVGDAAEVRTKLVPAARVFLVESGHAVRTGAALLTLVG
ncbi:MAG: hypothetical protein JWN81_920 [Solirubrobacterales bacterium]|jgi:hypothetical protein|nr:hypothetical protein [Solirubrobacterales bacterium]